MLESHHLSTLKFKRTSKPYNAVSQRGARGHALGGREARLGLDAGWATDLDTLAKALYNPALLPRP